MALITDIVQTTRNKGQMYEVFVDGESLGLYHIETIVKHRIVKGSNVDVEKLTNALVESGTLLAMEKTLNLISKSMKTEKEIKDYLKGKNYNDKIIENVICKLNEYNYINDEVYAKYFVSCHSKKQGNKKLKFDLIKKGVSEEVINSVLDETEEDLQGLKHLAEKYLKNKVKDFKTKSKLFAHLASKGYNYDNINKVINEFDWSEQNEDWL
ncbi:MAG: regulatory protein RecX [Clostridia bacterium]|nr:regulatory protein RecX [Clostridia bacterium]